MGFQHFQELAYVSRGASAAVCSYVERHATKLGVVCARRACIIAHAATSMSLPVLSHSESCLLRILPR